jgi:hypothetical protein
MRMLIAAFVLACGLLAPMAPAKAHPSPSSQVFLSVGSGTIAAEVTLPVDELKLAFPVPLLDTSGRWAMASDAQVAAYLAAHILPVAPDGRAWAVKVEHVRWELEHRPADIVAEVTLRPPPGAPLGTLALTIDAIAHKVPNHAALVALRDAASGPDAKPHLLGSLYYGHHTIKLHDAAPSAWGGFSGLFKLGMHHIAEGADHLLFLLTLLLPAALRADGGRWAGFVGARHLVRSLLTIVTAFTFGHSLTLALGATGLVVVPSQPVEVAIALSILVSAAHAWGPIFPRRECWIAAAFGLVHGLAFASALRELHLQGARLAAGIVAFNLGIEAVQAALVLLVAPLLVLLARTVYFAPVRQATAVIAAPMALAWLWGRVTGSVLLGFV